jgi:hypothetical protein
VFSLHTSPSRGHADVESKYRQTKIDKVEAMDCILSHINRVQSSETQYVLQVVLCYSCSPSFYVSSSLDINACFAFRNSCFTSRSESPVIKEFYVDPYQIFISPSRYCDSKQDLKVCDNGILIPLLVFCFWTLSILLVLFKTQCFGESSLPNIVYFK